MAQFIFTAYTDSSSAMTKSYTIDISNGLTLIDAGYNETYGLNEKWRQTELFTSDPQKKIIVTFTREFYSLNGIQVDIPGINKHGSTTIQDTPAIMGEDELGNLIEITPETLRFTFWDTYLGVPLIRKFIANAILEEFGLPPYFDQAALLGG